MDHEKDAKTAGAAGAPAAPAEGAVSAEAREETRQGDARQKKDLFLPASILAAAVLVAAAVVFAVLYPRFAPSPSPSGGQAAPSAAAPSGPTSTVPAATASEVFSLGPRDAILGNANAPVTLVEYGDYQCPFCGMFFSQTEPQIVKDYINTGKVKMVFRSFAFLGPESTAAAEAAECAEDQNKLWPYHDALYTAKVGDFNNGGREDDGFYNRARFLSLARQVGLNLTAFTSCVDGNKDAGLVSAGNSAASAVGVNSTPTFFVKGTSGSAVEIMGAEPYSVFQAALDSALNGS